MKLLIPFLLTVFFLSVQNTAFAVVHKNTNNTFYLGVILKDMSQTETPKAQKATFLQKYVSKMMAKNGLNAHLLPKTTKESNGDSLAKTGLINIVAGISSIALLIISALVSSETILFGILAFLAFMGFIALLGGFVQCLIALTKNNITPKGKKSAKTGLLLFAALVLLYVILWLVL